MSLSYPIKYELISFLYFNSSKKSHFSRNFIEFFVLNLYAAYILSKKHIYFLVSMLEKSIAINNSRA